MELAKISQWQEKMKFFSKESKNTFNLGLELKIREKLRKFAKYQIFGFWMFRGYVGCKNELENL